MEQKRACVLVVEDDPGIRVLLRRALVDDYDVHLAGDGREALETFARVRPGIVTLDLGLPPRPQGAEEGLRVLAAVLGLDPAVRVIVLTGNTDKANALRAVQMGAFDYYLKPVELEDFCIRVRRAAFLRQLEEEEEPAQETGGPGSLEGILGVTLRIREVMGVVERVAVTDTTVLIQGESGTGKELVASAIHARSARRDQPFVPINCGAIPETLLESELFGHEKGAFTGADFQRKGRLETAQGGTLFLDEIGELSPPLQVKLLRFLQDHQIERVGGRELIPLDVRVIAATNRDLSRALAVGKFRQDLFYRIGVVTIDIPPLRERRGDIPMLAQSFLEQFRAECGRPQLKGFTRDAQSALRNHAWPGNVRELENKVKRAVIMATGGLITTGDLGLEGAPGSTESALKAERDHVDHALVLGALRRYRGRLNVVAEELGISRPTLNKILERIGVEARDFKKPKRRST